MINSLNNTLLGCALENQNIVIFFEEIDSTLSLKFPVDDFFAFIRGCYLKRPDNVKYENLTICLIGVASPSDLMKDPRRTPFNIGHAITLTGFSLDEAEKALIPGLDQALNNSGEVLREIFEWTSGQPFLTQKIC